MATVQLRPPTSEELQSIEQSRRAYRALWANLKNVPHRAFDGSREDIDALDFIDYEGADHPEGLAGAARIWAGVFVNSGGLQWAVDGASELFVVDHVDAPRAAIHVRARLAEIRYSLPQYGKHYWAFEEAVLHLCSLPVASGIQQKLRSLLDTESDEDFLYSARSQINTFFHPANPRRST